MNIDEKVIDRACKEPTLLDALAYGCEANERAFLKGRTEIDYKDVIRSIIQRYPLPKEIQDIEDEYKWLNSFICDDDKSIMYNNVGKLLRYIRGQT